MAGRPLLYNLQPKKIHILLNSLQTNKIGAPLVAQMTESPPAMQATQIQSLGGEDLLEKEMATHSSILAWRIPWTEEPGRLQPEGQKSWTPLSD